MLKDIKEVVADGRSPLCAILEEWIRTNIDMARRWNGMDVPWWYNERASLSIFAGAVWRAGGIVLEEYSDTKFVVGPRSTQRKAKEGRCDCYFYVGTVEYIAEAKWGYSGATSKGSSPIPHIEDLLGAAISAASELRKNGQYRLAIAFVTPYFKAKFKGQEDKLIGAWVRKIRSVKADAMAWVFPKGSRGMQYRRGWDYCPGAAVFIREVPRAIR